MKHTTETKHEIILTKSELEQAIIDFAQKKIDDDSFQGRQRYIQMYGDSKLKVHVSYCTITWTDTNGLPK